jgi:hypothetical protein
MIFTGYAVGEVNIVYRVFGRTRVTLVIRIVTDKCKILIQYGDTGTIGIDRE